LAGAGNVRIGDEKLMTDSLKEQLSACLDGELRDGELELLLKRFERDPELQETLGRYALISQALQGQRPVAASTQFASKVQAAIDGEPVSPHRVHKRTGDTVRWLRPVAGFAVAAGVATVAILSLQRPGGAPEQPLVAANPPTVTTVDEPSYIVPETPAASTNSLIPATRLTNYVVAHSEYSSPLGRRTVLSGVLADDDVAEQDDGGLEPAVATEPVK
jgi:sigma-E factor negative regulatory protein RseA